MFSGGNLIEIPPNSAEHNTGLAGSQPPLVTRFTAWKSEDRHWVNIRNHRNIL